MKQKIVAFEQGEDGDWLAVLACGHRQHVRHNPPLVSRPWVQTETGRNQFLGYELNCKRCDDETDAAALGSQIRSEDGVACAVSTIQALFTEAGRR